MRRIKLAIALFLLTLIDPKGMALMFTAYKKTRKPYRWRNFGGVAYKRGPALK